MEESTITPTSIPPNSNLEIDTLQYVLEEVEDEVEIYERCYLNHYVEIYTYFSLYPLYGEIIEVTPYMVVLDSKYLGKLNESFNESAKFYLPLNSIISITII